MHRNVQRLKSLAAGLLLGVLPAPGAATSTGNIASLPSDLPALEARLAADPTNSLILVRTALECHNRAAFGSDDSAALLKRARSCLETVLQQEPGNTFARTLLGSAIIISAREPIWPGTRIRRVREGLAVMDAALLQNPDDADGRFTRASNNLFLPDLFKRKEWVREDFNWLQERADRQEFASDFRQYVYLYHGSAQKRWGDMARARALWEAGLKVDPGSGVADELRKELEGRSELGRIRAQ